jgi:hypothetical protein
MLVRTTTAISEGDRVLPKKLCPLTPEAHWPGLSMRELNAAVRPEDLHALIEEQAYGHAQARGFAPGHELDDWLAAEQEVHQILVLDV